MFCTIMTYYITFIMKLHARINYLGYGTLDNESITNRELGGMLITLCACSLFLVVGTYPRCVR